MSGDLLGEQPNPQLGDEEPDRIPLALGDARRPEGIVVPVADRNQRLQRLELVTGALDGVVRLGEVLEVGDDVSTLSEASTGSSMWLRTNSLRLPTDFIDTVWWNSSIACSDRMPSRRAELRPYSGKTLWISAPPARSRRRRSVRSEPKSVKSASIDSSFAGGDEEAVGLAGAVAAGGTPGPA